MTDVPPSTKGDRGIFIFRANDERLFRMQTRNNEIPQTPFAKGGYAILSVLELAAAELLCTASALLVTQDRRLWRWPCHQFNWWSLTRFDVNSVARCVRETAR